MDSTRQNKIARLIQKDLGEILLEESRDYFRNSILSITKVRISPDLSIARVYVSIYTPDDPKEVLEKIRKRAGEIRGKLGHRVAKQLRIVPTLTFFHDDSIEYSQRIDELLKS
ncbi:MAG: 30S ribosome-binding factor RbfA [Bacteroidota bacterium]|nr:30S ribosome-binding factor RbfA [Bacteroidota bacterium]